MFNFLILNFLLFVVWPSLISQYEKTVLAVHRCTAGNSARRYAESSSWLVWKSVGNTRRVGSRRRRVGVYHVSEHFDSKLNPDPTKRTREQVNILGEMQKKSKETQDRVEEILGAQSDEDERINKLVDARLI
jgi:hypothetical protein